MLLITTTELYLSFEEDLADDRHRCGTLCDSVLINGLVMKHLVARRPKR